MTPDPMPVPFALGSTRAHLMKWSERARCYVSPCGWDLHRRYPELAGDAAYGDVPVKPWCSGCRRYAGRFVSGYAAAGILVDAGDPYGD